MREPPAELAEDAVRAALTRHGGRTLTELTHGPVGPGGYHWTATDRDGRRWRGRRRSWPGPGAPAERDRRQVTEDSAELAHAAAAGGGPVPRAAPRRYRPRRDLDEIALHVGQFRARHAPGADSETAFAELTARLDAALRCAS